MNYADGEVFVNFMRRKKNMMTYLKLIFFISFLGVIITSIFEDVIGRKIFYELKNDGSNYIEKNIKSNVFLSDRWRFRIIVFLGRYKNIENLHIKAACNKLRKINYVGLLFLLICSSCIIISGVAKN